MCYLDIVLEAKAWLPGSPHFWGNAKWKEGPQPLLGRKRPPSELKGESRGLQGNELSCGAHHSDGEMKGVRLFRGFRLGSSRMCSRREEGKG